MKVGIIQPMVGQVGGNDSVLQKILKALEDHDITLFTFSKPENDYGCKVVTKFPKKLPAFGIYQSALMPKHDYSEMDVLIANSFIPKTEKPCMVYDQNQMANDFSGEMSEKYKKGFWKFYVAPYKFMKKFAKANPHCRYYSISEYSANALQNVIAKKVEVLYPGMEINERYNVAPKEEQVCILGRIAPEKNLEMAVEIANDYGGLTVLAGAVQEVNKPYLKKLKDMANSNVIIIENPDRQKFLQIMKESKVILSASKETLGLTQIEAINFGTVPIVPDNSAHPETVPLNSLRYTTVNDAIDKLHRIMNNSNIRMTMAGKLQENSQKFSFDVFSKRLNTILKEIKDNGKA